MASSIRVQPIHAILINTPVLDLLAVSCWTLLHRKLFHQCFPVPLTLNLQVFVYICVMGVRSGEIIYIRSQIILSCSLAVTSDQLQGSYINYFFVSFVQNKEIPFCYASVQ